MARFAKDLEEVIRLLENYPLESYSELAKKLGVSTQTFIRRVEELKEKNLIKEVHSSLCPESLNLERYIVLYKSGTIKGVKSLELACDLHPYTSSRYRLFGLDLGVYAVFDIPKGSKEKLLQFSKFLKEEQICDKYEIYKTQGVRIYHPHPYVDNILDLEEFDIEEYYVQSFSETYTGYEGREGREGRGENPPSLNLHPIDLLILRDITLNFRTPMSQLLEKYQNYLIDKKKKLPSYVFPENFKPQLESFFSTERSENAIYLDFKKRYHLLIDNYVESYWLAINRKSLDLFVNFGYLIKDISKEEKSRLLNLFSNKRPPFNVYLEDLGKDILLAMSLPPYYHTKLFYHMKERYKNFEVYLFDYFVDYAIKYRFYIENYDLKKSEWKQDEEWMVQGVAKAIKSKLERGIYRAVTTNKEE